MHFHLPFSTGDILWTLTFAGYLVLLVVLMGRDRIRRYPWFTASIIIMALRILSIRLLVRRLPELTLDTIILVMADVLGFVALFVVVELARRAFAGVRRSTWIVCALVLMALGGVVLKFWGPWPSWSAITAQSTMSTLRLLQLIGQKATLVADVETIAVGFLIVLLGSWFNAGSRSHTQQIAIGLSTASISALLVEVIWENVLRTAQANPAIVQSVSERQRVLALGSKLSNTNSTVYIVILVWWIVCLWRDEPGGSTAAEEPSDASRPAGIEAESSDAVTPAPEVE